MRTIVVGAGAAGLWTALHALERGPVVLVAPDPARHSATALAQGGIAAAIGEGDSPKIHAADTVETGEGLCEIEAVRVLTDGAPAAVDELRRLGMSFDEGVPTIEGGHSVRRVLHSGGDATGGALLEVLTRAAAAESQIERVEDRAGRLLLDGDRVCGVATEGLEVAADRVILATGGACGIFERRTGPGRATGDGMLLAWDAGAILADLEFVQFHPTAADVPGHPARLLTEALRGEGAVLRDAAGERFMPRLDERAELAPRDIVARAIAAVRAAGGAAYLDAGGVANVRARFPTAARTCEELGLDLERDPIPVAPAAHYFLGGVLTDTWGRTSVRGLLACGEVACPGVHGANRLASNSLLEALAFGRRAAAAEDAPFDLGSRLERLSGGGLPAEEASPPLGRVRSLVERALGVSRSGPGMTAAIEGLGRAGGPGGDRAATLIARLVALAALRREESRGVHFREDHPAPSPEWRFRQAVDSLGWTALALA